MPADPNEWSVLRPNLLRVAADHIFDREATEREVSRVRTLFNTWQNSGAIAVTPDGQSDVWRERYPYVEAGCKPHAWGDWSPPYQAVNHDSTSRRYGPPLADDPDPFPWWQERRCACGNREFRPSTQTGEPR